MMSFLSLLDTLVLFPVVYLMELEEDTPTCVQL